MCWSSILQKVLKTSDALWKSLEIIYKVHSVQTPDNHVIVTLLHCTDPCNGICRAWCRYWQKTLKLWWSCASDHTCYANISCNCNGITIAAAKIQNAINSSVLLACYAARYIATYCVATVLYCSVLYCRYLYWHMLCCHCALICAVCDTPCSYYAVLTLTMPEGLCPHCHRVTGTQHCPCVVCRY